MSEILFYGNYKLNPLISRMTLLLGPPGAGKTTLLLALAGKLDQDLRVCFLLFLVLMVFDFNFFFFVFFNAKTRSNLQSPKIPSETKRSKALI